MCEFFSCIVMKDKTTFWDAELDNHHEILEKFNIPDNSSNPAEMRFARVEILPPADREGVFEKDLENWTLTVDERVRPEWFSPAHELAAFEALKACLAVRVFDGTYISEVIEIRDDRKVFVRNASVAAYGQATVTAYGQATVTAYGQATVTACDRATVTAYDQATVEAYGRATVKAYDRASVTACDRASVTAYGQATVKAYDQATVTAYGQATALVWSENVKIDLLSEMAAVVCRFDGKLTFKRKE